MVWAHISFSHKTVVGYGSILREGSAWPRFITAITGQIGLMGYSISCNACQHGGRPFLNVSTLDASFDLNSTAFPLFFFLSGCVRHQIFGIRSSDIRSLAPYKHVCSLIVHDLMKSVSFIQQWCLLNCKLTMHSTAVSEWRTSWCKRSNALRCVS